MRALGRAVGLCFLGIGLLSGCASEDDCGALCEELDGGPPHDASLDASGDAEKSDMADSSADMSASADMTVVVFDASTSLDMAVVPEDASTSLDMAAELPDAGPDAALDARVPTCVDDPSLCTGFTYCDVALEECASGCANDDACGELEACDEAHACVCAEGTILVRGACKAIEDCDIDAVLTSDDDVLDILHCSLLRSLSVAPASTVTAVSLPVLETVTNDVVIKQSTASEAASLTELDFPSLTRVGRDFDVQYNPLLAVVDAPELETVGRDLLVLFSGEDALSTEVSFASLTSVGKRFAYYLLPKLTSVSAPKLDSVGSNVVVSTCGADVPLMTIDFSSLRIGNANEEDPATTYFEVDFNPSLREARFPMLTTFDAYVLLGYNGTNVDSFEAEVPLLTDIEQADISGNTTMTLLDLSSLETIDAFFYFGLNGGLESPLVVKFGSLRQTGEVQVGRCTMESLDLSGIESWSSIAVSSNPLLTELDVTGSHAAGVSIPGGASATANPKLCALTGTITAGAARTPFVYTPPTGCDG